MNGKSTMTALDRNPPLPGHEQTRCLLAAMEMKPHFILDVFEFVLNLEHEPRRKVEDGFVLTLVMGSGTVIVHLLFRIWTGVSIACAIIEEVDLRLLYICWRQIFGQELPS